MSVALTTPLHKASKSFPSQRWRNGSLEEAGSRYSQCPDRGRAGKAQRGVNAAMTNNVGQIIGAGEFLGFMFPSRLKISRLVVLVG